MPAEILRQRPCPHSIWILHAGYPERGRLWLREGECVLSSMLKCGLGGGGGGGLTRWPRDGEARGISQGRPEQRRGEVKGKAFAFVRS